MKKIINNKKLLLIVLFTAIIGISIGFSAFNAALNIVNTTATGTKANNDVNFKDKLNITNISCDGDLGTYEVGNISTDSFSWSGVSVQLSNPNESITCTATVKNNSSYSAYLNSILLNNNIVCNETASDSALAACNGLELKVNGNIEGKAEAIATATSHTDAINVTDDFISAESTGKISFTVTYKHNTALDADYNAILPTMTFNYSTVD